jgi:hypothetical protein
MMWAANDSESPARQAKRQKIRTNPANQPDDVTIITNTTAIPKLLHQQNMIMFDDDSDTGNRFGFGVEQESESDSDDEEDEQEYMYIYSI